MKFHPLADMFPLIEGEDFDDLVTSIRSNGQLEPIILMDGEILDGRNRWRACQAAGIEPRFEIFSGGDPISFVMDINLHRRHLEPGQRAMIGARLAKIKNGSNQYVTKGAAAAAPSLYLPEIAKMVGVNKSSLSYAKVILDLGTAEQIKAVDDGKAGFVATARSILKDKGSSHQKKSQPLSRNENIRIRTQLWAHLKTALDNIRHLPRPDDVAAHMRAHGRAVQINEGLPVVLQWMEDFSYAWNAQINEAGRNGRGNHDHAGDGDQAA